MNIALIESHAVPGVWKYDLGLARELSRLGVHVTIITSKSFPPVERESFAGEILRDFPDLRAHTYSIDKGIRYLIGTFRALGRIRKGNFDVVHWQHFNTLPPAETLMAKVIRWWKQPLIITVHDIDPWSMVKGKADFLLRATFHAAGRLIVHHNANRSDLSVNYRIPEEIIRVVPHGSYASFSSALPDRRSSRLKLGLPVEAPILLFFGEIRPEKGLIHLIRAMKSIHARLPDARLVIAGRPRHMDMSECLMEIRNAGLDEVVITHLKYIEDSSVEAYFAMADLVALPYVAITQSGVLFEAMTVGCPVVATDTGGLGPTVIESGVGSVVPPGDAQALANAVLEILGNRDLAAQMGRNGRHAAEHTYSWSRCAKETAEIYLELTSTRQNH
jgi:glycosyltransferase involved in cell wall biosynthesis